MGAEELTGAPATALAALVADRAVSAGEVVEAHLQRIEEVDATVNAVVQLDAEGATARAREADEALAAGRSWGPLHGVPFSAKDNIAAAGIVMAIGDPERAGVVAAEDATVVARLRAAGAILLAHGRRPAGTSSRSRYGARTARSARRGCTACCAAGTPTAPRCSPSPSATT